MRAYEYSKIDTEKNSLYESLETCGDKDEFLDKLFSYLERLNLKKALIRGHKEITTQNYVGVIKYKNFQLDILPKMLKSSSEGEDEHKTLLKNLTFMLSYTNELDIKSTNTGKLADSKNPFIEILIREYAQSLFDCLKRLTPKRYIREEDNLNFLKGKLKFAENIRYNCSNDAKFYCEYDEFSENNLLNQLFLYVATCLYKISRDSRNKKLLAFITNYFCDIDCKKFDRFKLEKIKLSKNQEMFKKPFDLAKMFVNHSSLDLSRNRFENITLLWDMNLLFEEFIYNVIRKHTAYNPKYQKGRRLLIGDETKRKYGNTYTDMYLEKDGEKVIIDTKYKLNSGENSDFENKDVYQIMTYCLIHSSDNAMFIYPTEKGTENDNIKYYLNTEIADKNKKNLDNVENVQKLLSVILNLKTDLKSDVINLAEYIEKQLDGLLLKNEENSKNDKKEPD